MPSLNEQRAQLLKSIQDADTMESIKEFEAQLEVVDAKLKHAAVQSAVLTPAQDTVIVPANEGAVAAKSLGEHFVKFREAHPSADNRIIATPFRAKAAGDPTTSSGLVATEFDTVPVRRVAAPLSVLDLFARKTISAPVYSWNVYSSTTGSAGTTAEGAAKNKLTYAYVPKTATLAKITGLIKLTEELFADAPYVADAINQDLVDDLNAARQANAITTLLGTSGLQTKSVTYADAVDIFKGILAAAADVEDATHIAPDAVIVTPAVWLLLRSAVDEKGHFYAGEPFGDSDYSRLFEMTFIKSADVTANHVIVGAFNRGAELVSKADGVRVDSTNSNDVDFEKNLVSIRAEAREILAVKRPAAFCNVTLTASA